MKILYDPFLKKPVVIKGKKREVLSVAELCKMMNKSHKDDKIRAKILTWTEENRRRLKSE